MRIPIESCGVCGFNPTGRSGKKYVFRERASVLMGAVLPKKMDGEAAGSRLYGNWTECVSSKLNKTPRVLASGASVKKDGFAEVEGNSGTSPEFPGIGAKPYDSADACCVRPMPRAIATANFRTRRIGGKVNIINSCCCTQSETLTRTHGWCDRTFHTDLDQVQVRC